MDLDCTLEVNVKFIEATRTDFTKHVILAQYCILPKQAKSSIS